MADNNNNDVEITPGSEEFAKMVFKLNDPINAENVATYNYNGASMDEVQPGVYAQPAFINEDVQLFFLATKLIGDDWILAFSKATIENDNEVTDLGEPIPTGEGMNLVGSTSPDDANALLQYFNTLTEAKRGEWRMIQ